MKKVVGMFPGQGSQTVGMGASLYESNEIARDLFERANKVLGFSLSEICFQGPLESLTLTAHAQPAILTVSYICYKLADIPLVAAAGHSLGEFSALLAAECMQFEDAVVLVHKRGTYMQEAVPAGEGSMAAIMGPDEASIAGLLSQVTSGVVEIANLNCPGQTVIAGESKAVAEASELLVTAGAKAIPLNVSAPFHCSLMQPAAERLAADLAAITMQNPKFPVYANVTATPVTTAEQARELLVKQVTGSVRWTDSIQTILKDIQPDLFVEFGAGDVLSKLLKRIDRAAVRESVTDLASASAVRDNL